MRELFRNLNVKVLTPEEELHGPTMQNQEPLYISCFSRLRPFLGNVSFRQCWKSRSAPE